MTDNKCSYGMGVDKAGVEGNMTRTDVNQIGTKIKFTITHKIELYLQDKLINVLTKIK